MSVPYWRSSSEKATQAFETLRADFDHLLKSRTFWKPADAEHVGRLVGRLTSGGGEVLPFEQRVLDEQQLEPVVYWLLHLFDKFQIPH